MECSFIYTRKGDFGMVELAGKKDFSHSRQIWERILQFIVNDCLTKMLVIDNMINAITEHHVFELGKWLSTSQFPREVRIAIVDPEKSVQGNMNAFGETVLLNRGFYNIRVFSDNESASAWLDTESRHLAST